MIHLSHDLRIALRLLARAPGFGLASVLTLALGIGATTAVYSYVSALWSARAPVKDMERLVGLWSLNRAEGNPKSVVSVPDFVDWRSRNRSFERVAASERVGVNLSGVDEPVRLVATRATAGYLEVLGLGVARGRSLAPADEAPGAMRVCLIGDRLWRERFSGEPTVLGRSILIDGEPVSIVGVLAPEEITGNLLLPLTIDPTDRDRSRRSVFVIGRLRDDVSLERARAEMDAVGTTLAGEHPAANRGWGVNTRPLSEEFLGANARIAFAILAGAVAVVLLIGCANVANLMLARALGRTRELAVRSALGATGGRLFRQVLTEASVIAGGGCALGLVLARWGLQSLRASLDPGSPGLDRIGLNLDVLLFTAGAAIIATLLFGAAPAIQAARVDALSSLHGGTRTTGGGKRARQWLVGAQVALAVLLLAVTGLLARTLVAIERIEPGFDMRNLLTASVTLPESRYPDPVRAAAFFERASERMAAIPGAIDAGATSRVPFAGNRFNPRRSLAIDGRQPAAEADSNFAVDFSVTPGYLRALRVPLHAGRDITASDAAGAPMVAVVNQTMAARYWTGRSAVGGRIRLGNEPEGAWRTVVGVVGDIRNDDVDSPALPYVFLPAAQEPTRSMSFVLRTTSDPVALVPAVRAAAAALDPDQPLYDIRTMERIIDEDLGGTRVLIAVLASFGLLALLLASIGILGVVSFLVGQRTREIGLRVALGATPAQVLRLVTLQGLGPVALGLLGGLAAALAVARVMTSLLYQVAPGDPATFGAVAAACAVAALAASIAPVRRALRIDPIAALHCE